MEIIAMNGKFNIILADPPWSYSDKCASGHRGVEYKYSCMTSDQLKRMDVQSILADNCALFLWSPGPQIPVALEVMSSWGFKFKTVAFTWIKFHTKSGKLCWGMGNYTRANPEFVLLGTKGKLPRASAAVHSVINAPRMEHSSKPQEVNNRIVELLGEIPRIELFARHLVEGWKVWGDEVNSDVEIDIVPPSARRRAQH